MGKFLLCSTEQEIIIIKTTEKVTVYILNAVKSNEKTSKQQRQFLIFDEEYKPLEILEHKVSKHRRSTKIHDEPKSLLMKNTFISLRDILIGSISGAIGTILTPKLQELYHYLEYIFSTL
ncbi:hypothetical protein HX13_01215 [Chryseobacterium sp. P1-3]|uniref:hypothetical protein n=1 Tax=Chryseobacterium sp. (strain P1-3) TaxID=1517683 RepID=UPI0004E7A41F|nr:hypothetical protein [Chryseobacterium sp. P1-3]KFF76003.1 hypothetical protein HX13_01215 [Chryseobacterium sp. P1-3]